jgi:hypothetical protein
MDRLIIYRQIGQYSLFYFNITTEQMKNQTMKNIVLLICVFVATTSYGQTIEDEINKLTGEFAGEWTTYKLNESGAIVKAYSWIDTLRASDPVITKSEAYITVKGFMHFEDPNIPPYKIQFKEGFKITNGKVGAHFYTILGVESIETKISENTYVITNEISPLELPQLGFKTINQGVHTTIKVVLHVNGKEIHKISRISTITWEEENKEKEIQFLSMEGNHTRVN